jgi:quercetin dioxygenase-like cupin family protein
MNKKKYILGNVIAIIGLSVFIYSCSTNKTESEITRTELQRHDLGTPGLEAVQILVGFGPGVVAGNHKHPGEEIIYVTEGTLEYHVEGKAPITLKAGEVLFIPAGIIHSAKNVGKNHGAELATYIVEKGKPLVEMVK